MFAEQLNLLSLMFVDNPEKASRWIDDMVEGDIFCSKVNCDCEKCFKLLELVKIILLHDKWNYELNLQIIFHIKE